MATYLITSGCLSASEIRRWLKQQGCTFEERKRHTLVRLGSRCSLLPRHSAKEIKTGTLNGILRDLGLKTSEGPEMIHYPALFEPDERKGGFVSTFPDFEWGMTQGETSAESTQMAEDALVCILEETIRQHRDMPRPSKVRGKKYREIAVPALVDAKIQLYGAMRAGRVQTAELARRMDIPRQQ